MAWVVIISVLIMTVLSLLRVNVIVAITIAALSAGLMSGLSLIDSVDLFVAGMGGQSSTALSYILLGAFAVAISYTGITTLLVHSLVKILTGKKAMLVLAIAGIASLSQNLVPVHIAFIPILIPPLLKIFDEMKLDRRAVASALTFGLKAPYIMISAGFGLLFHETILEGMKNNGMSITVNEIALSLLIPGSGMIVGLLIAVFITYRKDKAISNTDHEVVNMKEGSVTPKFNVKHLLTIVAIIAALVVQIITENLILGALTGLILMFIFVVVPFKKGDTVISEGVAMMGTIAFVMLVASGFGHIIKETGAVNELVGMSMNILGTNKPLIAFTLLLIGLVITMGIGSSFGTVPILAALYVPICIAAGFSPLATAALIGTAGALGDAGSPASDSTLGPTSGLNADGKHHHIWDTCVPTFLHFNIPLFLFGWVAALIL
ncbi:Na+/H+ antiporter family protein [Aquibacillus rhizosphaerae]|uniref:Na+/H+ antiporter NhaC family protein n=1 Tax=Aquibacillus rhizosphaerae TaxID=3051431 RepID=A0ABT7L9C2_9BACI|nr:Na+/H+ antiporter NhaC family protein [Aquibacillus sp. LR5S19]MDL4841837.1 Na+/H+ antiporter NhaC family protein [Aquibacillus sp. LR5S19]